VSICKTKQKQEEGGGGGGGERDGEALEYGGVAAERGLWKETL